MIRFASKATLLSAVALVIAGAALAGVPNATNSTLGGTHLTLTGYNTTIVPGQNTPQPFPPFNYEQQSITVRDAANNPVANSVVVLNFNACYNGVGPKLSTAQPPGMTLSGRTVSGTTNASGVVIFKICGGSSNTVQNGPEPVNCVSVVADGVPLGSFSVATFEENGLGGIDGADFSGFAADRNAPQPANYRNRSDYNKDNIVNGSDFSLFAAARNGQYGGAAGGSVAPYQP